MDPVVHKHCNDTLTPGANPNTVSLPVARGLMGALRVVRSYWVPTAEELKILNKTGCVAFTVMGQTHPPIRVDAVPLEFKSILDKHPR